ncbi:MAG: hypothetical protein ACLVIY_11595 [Anaerobutyricum soehngenii]
MIPEEQEMTEKKAESRTEKEEGSEDISIKDAKEPEQVQESDRKSAIEGGRREEQLKEQVDIPLRTVRPDTESFGDYAGYYKSLFSVTKKQ